MTDLTFSNRDLHLAASVFGPPDAPAALFLHGFSLSRDTWEEAAQRLAGRFQVWTLDFRGHGHSDRADAYDLEGFVSDARTALAAIGRPALVIGHSLGGVVAGALAQQQSGNVRAVVLEDPPWYLGEPEEWRRSGFRQLFAIANERQAAWRKENAPLAAYLDFVSNAPSPMGGPARDHIAPRHLLSQASALQRQDTRSYRSILQEGDSVLAAVATAKPFASPALIVQADPHCGAALLDGHDRRLAKTNPQAKIVRYVGSGHSPHRALAFEERFFADLETFAAALGR
jgi:pimeloyl-ACP methyl ester carboxylesterase